MRWNGNWLFAAGLIVGGVAVGALMHQPSLGGAVKAEPWALPNFNYYDQTFPGAEYIGITGSLVGDDAAYQVNTWNIRCTSFDKKCVAADVEEIGRRQLGEINITEFAVDEWTPAKVSAHEDAACARNSLVIDRRAKLVRYLSEPINSGGTECTKLRDFIGGHAQVNDWRIGDPVQPWERK